MLEQKWRLGSHGERHETQDFVSLRFEVEHQPRPGLQLEAAEGVLRLSLAGSPVLWARQDAHWQGIWVLQRNGAESPLVLPPWSFAECRAQGEGSSPGFVENWAKATAAALQTSPRSPLTEGTFVLSAAAASGTALKYSARVRQLEAPWGLDELYGGSQPEYLECEVGRVLPLRQRPSPDGGRVKAWRKAAREGHLPPPLFFWVSGLNVFLLLDGHARLVAAQLEQVPLRHALVLWRSVERPNVGGAWQAEQARRYLRGSERFAEWTTDTTQYMNDALVSAFAPSHSEAMNRATANPALPGEFVAQVKARLIELGQSPGHEMLQEGMVAA
jgi:hypothetical protein